MVNEKPQEITKLNTRQLSYGFDRNGEVLGQYRSTEYAHYKEYLNSRAGYGNVDLYVTGAYYRSFKAAAKNGQLFISATDSKAPKLERKYDPNRIYGLDGESVIDYRRDTLKPEISQRFRQKVLQ